jgi:hypothetical protein
MSREWESVREMERESFRVRPSRDDVNSVRRIRLRPSCDVKIRYRVNLNLRDDCFNWSSQHF